MLTSKLPTIQMLP